MTTLDAIRSATGSNLRLYPDPEGYSLRQAIANANDIDPSNVFLGNGSDEVLAHAFLALLKHQAPILFPDITYGFYPVYCSLYEIDYEEIPLGSEFQIDIENYTRPNGGIIFPNPNAPTGCALSLESIHFLLEHWSSSVVVIDEAYVDFGAESAVQLIKRFPNLLITRTLSKSRSLAGLRVGYALGNPDLIEALNVVKGCFNSYPLDRLALVGGEAALTDNTYYEEVHGKIVRDREWLRQELEELGFSVLPSKANFLFARHKSKNAKLLQKKLRENNILVRHFTKSRIENFLRITIGTPEECQELVRCLRGLES